MKYALITYSTDMRSPNYKIEFTTSKARALKHYNHDAVLTHNDPETARNYHHTITSILELESGFRKPTKQFISDESFRLRGSIYSPNASGILYSYICKHSSEFEIKEA